LTEQEKDKTKESLTIIMRDSRRHSLLFNQLLQVVADNGEDKY